MLMSGPMPQNRCMIFNTRSLYVALSQCKENNDKDMLAAALPCINPGPAGFVTYTVRNHVDRWLSDSGDWIGGFDLFPV